MSFTVTSVAVTLYAALLLIYFLFNMTGKDKATGKLKKENAYTLTRKRHLTLVSLRCGRTGRWAGGWAYGHVITKFRGYISLPILLYHPLPIESFTIKEPPSNKHRTEMKELCTQSSKYSTPFTSSSSFCSISSCKSLCRSASSSCFQNVKEYSMINRYIDKNMACFITISTP